VIDDDEILVDVAVEVSEDLLEEGRREGMRFRLWFSRAWRPCHERSRSSKNAAAPWTVAAHRPGPHPRR
jgi:hypothetical protein